MSSDRNEGVMFQEFCVKLSKQLQQSSVDDPDITSVAHVSSGGDVANTDPYGGAGRGGSVLMSLHVVATSHDH